MAQEHHKHREKKDIKRELDGPEKVHDDRLEAIIQDPGLIGLKNIISCYKETQWYSNHKLPGSTPDLIMTDGKFLYILEYKTHHSVNAQRTGEKQLRTIMDWFYVYGVDSNTIRPMLVYGEPGNFEAVYYNKKQLESVKLENYRGFRKNRRGRVVRV